MALNPNIEFASRVTPPDANYAYGSSKDETSPGANDGTPYTKRRADDIFGFQQALMLESGIVPTNNPDTQLVSQYAQAMYQTQQRRNLFTDGAFQFSQERGATFSVTQAAALAGAQYATDSLIIHGTGGSNPITGAIIDAVTDGRRKKFVEINSNNASDTNLFARMFVQERVGGRKVSISIGMTNASGAASFNPLLTVDIVNASRVVQTTPVSSFDLGALPGDGATYRKTHTFTMPSDANTAGFYIMVSFTLPGRDYTSGTLRLSEAQFELGPYPTPFEILPYGVAVSNAQSLYEKSYNPDTPVGTVTNIGDFVSVAQAGVVSLINHPYSTPKRRAPTVVFYSNVTGAPGKVRDLTAGADIAVVNASASENSYRVVSVIPIPALSTIVGHFSADARL